MRQTDSPPLTTVSPSKAPEIGTAPWAPKQGGKRSSEIAETERIIQAYGAVLSKRTPSPPRRKHGTISEQDTALSTWLNEDQFALVGGRSISELPAPKHRIEEAIMSSITMISDRESRDTLATGLLMLADFQDLEWCQASNVDPVSLRAYDETRFVEFLNGANRLTN